MRHRALLLVGALVGVVAMSTVAIADSGERGKSVRQYTAALAPIADNPAAQGTATLSLKGNRLTVAIDATGLEPGQVHPQHIHGFGKGTGKKVNSTCPTAADDANDDGVVDLGEGLSDYGPVMLPFTPFPTADEDGEIHFRETYKIKRGQLGPLTNRAIVLHGAFVDGDYVATLPVACGQIEAS